MSWIKRNLLFVIGSVVALALMGLAGWFLYTKWQLNNEILTKLNSDSEELKRLKSQNPHPGNEKVNNIELARRQQRELSNFVYKARAYFAPIPRIPSEEDSPKVTDQSFTGALSRTIDQLQKQATNSSVMLPPGYSFSFEAQKSKVSFTQAGLLPLATQLGEVKAICDVLFAAKINSLDNIRRERLASEDSLGGLQTDYFTEKTTTNDLAVLTPYEVTFKCFSSELASVLGGFGSSPYAFIVKTINVEAAPATAASLEPGMPMTPTYMPMMQSPLMANPASEEAATAARMAQRYGLGRGGAGRGAGRYGGAGGADYGGVPLRSAPAVPQPVYVPPPVAAAASKSGVLPTVLDERQLKVTANLVVVKLLPPK